MVIEMAVIGILQPYMADDYIFLNLAESNNGLLNFLGSLYSRWTGRLHGLFFIWLEMQNAFSQFFVKALHGLEFHF
ncbi:MAG: hypothetical protein CVU89_06210 [Firmicutes bacterium HGW-Firmicutes-14]|nr:MAG: hypothetical protein CVU89_06210 [Firmicutes bacterium HGW-Firmicutes-14]